MTEETPKRREKILVVDDETDLRGLLKERLEMEGYQVEEASDGEKALGKVKKFKPDLILLDVMMPKMNGFRTLERLKSDKATMGIPVFMLTGRSEEEDIEKGIQGYAEKYILKPFDFEQLVGEINKTFALRNKGI